MKLRNKVKKDLEDNLEVCLSYDTSTLEIKNEKQKVNKHKGIKIAAISLASLLVVGIATPIIYFNVSDSDEMLNIKDERKVISKKFSENEIAIANSNAFTSLNEVSYPELDAFKRNKISDEYVLGNNNFAYTIYKSLEKIDNISFSPYSLYQNMSILSLGSDVKDVNDDFDKVLGVNKEQRDIDFVNSYKNNYIVNEEGTLQTYNGAFLTNQYKVNDNLISQYSKYYTDAYQLDFNDTKSVTKMLDWIDQRVNEKNFFPTDELEIDKDSVAYLISTLYFDNRWASMFNNADSYKGKFNVNSSLSVDVDYMQHEYHGKLYDYDSYYSFYDYYANGIYRDLLIWRITRSGSRA